MEILLLQDVPGVGKKNDLLIVRDGFALNCLLPQRQALVATPTVRKRYADQIKKRAEEKETEKQVTSQMAGALIGKSISVSRKATKAGKLYGGVSAEDVAAELKTQHSITIAVDTIDLDEAIKTIGTHQVPVNVGNQSLTINVIVEAEKAVVKKK